LTKIPKNTLEVGAVAGATRRIMIRQRIRQLTIQSTESGKGAIPPDHPAMTEIGGPEEEVGLKGVEDTHPLTRATTPVAIDHPDATGGPGETTTETGAEETSTGETGKLASNHHTQVGDTEMTGTGGRGGEGATAHLGQVTHRPPHLLASTEAGTAKGRLLPAKEKILTSKHPTLILALLGPILTSKP
jgi:hypothetical protein